MRKTIIIIDDEPGKIRYYERALVDCGFDVRIVREVNKAWKLLEEPETKIDAIILDIILPQIDGLVVAPGSEIGIALHKHLATNMSSSGRTIPLALLTQLSRVENADIFEDIEKEHRLHFPDQELQIWSKIGVDPDEFATEFRNWLETMEKFKRT